MPPPGQPLVLGDLRHQVPLPRAYRSTTPAAVGITDGGTIKARCDGQQIAVRLSDIDTPEKKQPYGERSKQHLTTLCYGRQAEIIARDKDRYGRLVPG